MLRYDLLRSTNDIDVMAVRPYPVLRPLLEMAGPNSSLAAKYQIYIDALGRGVGSWPCDYESRLEEMFRGTFDRTRLFAPEVHDLALTKLDRNGDRDREDVVLLVLNSSLDVKTLRERYETELRPYLLGPEAKHDLTMNLWVEMIEEVRARRAKSIT